MEVPKELLDKWKVMRSAGDPGKIVDSMPEDIRVSKETIRRVFSEGQCSDEVFEAIARYYDDKLLMLSKYMSAAVTTVQS